MTVQDFANALCVALAKRGARVKIHQTLSHSTTVYLTAKHRSKVHSIRVSDHPPGKKWKSGLNATSVDISKVSKLDVAPEVIAVSIMGYLKDGL